MRKRFALTYVFFSLSRIFTFATYASIERIILMLKIRTFTIDRFNFFKRQVCVNRSKIQFNCAVSFNNAVFLCYLVSVRTYSFANKHVVLFF